MFDEVVQSGTILASNSGKGLTIVKKDKRGVVNEPFSFAVKNEKVIEGNDFGLESRRPLCYSSY